MKRMEITEDNNDSHSSEGLVKQATGETDSPEQHAVEVAVEELMDELDTQQHCDVDVSVDGKWCTFEGKVDSQEIRTALFDLVPSQDGKRFIVDRLHVTYEAGHTDEL